MEKKNLWREKIGKRLWENKTDWRIVLYKMISAKYTEFIKVITGVRRSGKSTLMLMFKDYLLNDDVKNRELRSLENRKDNYEKIILTMDKSINNDYNGIKIINIIDFLLEEEK